MQITKEVLENELNVLVQQEAQNRTAADRSRSAADQALGAIQLAQHLLSLLSQGVSQEELEGMLGGKIASIDRIKDQSES